MDETAIVEFSGRDAVTDPLTDLLRKGARELLRAAVEAERDAFLAEFAERRTSDDRAAVLRSGYHPERAVQTGTGPVTVKVPKVRAKDGKPVTFRPALVPPCVRKSKSIEAALPWLYLKGISTGEMGAALKMFPGPDATGFSAKTVSRLKAQWAAEYLPKRTRPKARKMLHDIWQAETREDAHAAFDVFIGTFEAKYPKATECLLKDPDELLTFFDFPAQHWQSIRTSNPIESAFARIRHQTKRTKGCLSRDGMLHMMFKLGQCAEKSWRKLRGFAHLADVIEGVDFLNGIKSPTQDQATA